MRHEPHEPTRFGRDSPVLRHWLANSTGFRVKGRHTSGVVERVFGPPGAPTSVAVRRRFRRRVVVAADAFDEVVPEEQLLIAAGCIDAARLGGRRRARRAALIATTATGRAAKVALRYSARGLAASARASGHAGTIAARASSRAGAAIGRTALRIARDATLTLVELWQAARPHVRRFAAASARELAAAVERLRETLREAQARRRRAELFRSLETAVAALGRERADGNGHGAEPPPPKRAPKERRAKTTV